MNEKEQKDKNADEILEIKKFSKFSKMLKIFFIMHQKLIKKIKIKDWRKYCRKDEIKKTKIELNIIAKTKEKQKQKKNNTLFIHYFDYSNPENMFKKLRSASDEKN